MSKLPTSIAESPGVEEAPLLDATAGHRTLLLRRGMAAIGFALLIFFWPRLAVPGLTLLWGGYSLVDGVLALTAAMSGKSGTPRAWLGLIGMAGIACAGAVLVASEQVAQHLVPRSFPRGRSSPVRCRCGPR